MPRQTRLWPRPPAAGPRRRRKDRAGRGESAGPRPRIAVCGGNIRNFLLALLRAVSCRLLVVKIHTRCGERCGASSRTLCRSKHTKPARRLPALRILGLAPLLRMRPLLALDIEKRREICHRWAVRNGDEPRKRSATSGSLMMRLISRELGAELRGISPSGRLPYHSRVVGGSPVGEGGRVRQAERAPGGLVAGLQRPALIWAIPGAARTKNWIEPPMNRRSRAR